MDIRELTHHMHTFVSAKGWYAPKSPRPQTPRNLAASLVLEAAEVLEHYQWNDAANPTDLAGELADVALYLLQLASVTGIDLEQAILEKLKVNYEREWPHPLARESSSITPPSPDDSSTVVRRGGEGG